MLSRRDLMYVAGSPVFAILPSTMAAQRNPISNKVDPASVKALTFDTFGTVVDWRGSIIEEGNRYWKPKGMNVDWAKFADAWRSGYGPSMARVRNGEIPWTNLDALHRMVLDKLLVDFGVNHLTESDKEHLNRIWHRLRPWPDAVSGLTRLKKRFIIAPLSNGNLALLTNMAKFAGLPWDCILSAELARHYKPDPEVYLSAVELLQLKNSEVMMVAAHRNDLQAAGKLGLRTAFVARPLEYGPNREPEKRDPNAFDIVAKDFNDLAFRLSA